ncbi:hypothetical protein [Burkholderia diffusa]|uniref:hypothetical protein n=1 Tax=Burkholderia diffusa TaxID=488732 RepID=UPI001478A2FF|nr:hypothetical protein [Burkholderia diffusa]MBM2652255.1 hypothetical protein [Burkholderia diffusa]
MSRESIHEVIDVGGFAHAIATLKSQNLTGDQSRNSISDRIAAPILEYSSQETLFQHPSFFAIRYQFAAATLWTHPDLRYPPRNIPKISKRQQLILRNEHFSSNEIYINSTPKITPSFTLTIFNPWIERMINLTE